MALVPDTPADKAAQYKRAHKEWAKKNPDMAKNLTPSGNYHPILSPHQFNVYWAHSKDSIKEGRLEEGVSNITVLAGRGLRGNIRAKRVAEQMVIGRGKEPTRTEWVP